MNKSKSAALAPCAGLPGLPDQHVGKVEDQGGRERHGELLGDLAEEISPQKLKMNPTKVGIIYIYVYIYMYVYLYLFIFIYKPTKIEILGLNRPKLEVNQQSFVF